MDDSPVAYIELREPDWDALFLRFFSETRQSHRLVGSRKGRYSGNAVRLCRVEDFPSVAPTNLPATEMHRGQL